MNLYDKSSLVLANAPAFKQGAVQAYKPLNSEGEFKFVSTSSSTRVNEDGLIEKERSNQLLQSNTFDTTWVKGDVTLTSSQSGYDGSSDAWLLTKNDAFGRLEQTISLSGVQAYSLYAKANDSDWIFFRVDYSGGTASGYFDLANGVGGSFGNVIHSDITSVGNGWYRIQIVFNETINIVRIYPAEDNNQIGGTSGSIYIQDAQLEKGLVATEYIATSTVPVYKGVTSSFPTLTHKDDKAVLALEPSRTNFELNSEYFNEPTANQELTITANTTTSPEGLVNATRIIDNAVSGYHRFYNFPTLTAASGTTMTHSIFAKADGHSWFQISSGGSTDSQWANFDLTNGVVGNSSASANADIQPMGNGWYRCILNSSTTGASSQTISTIISLTNDTDVSTRFSTYSGTGNGIFIWGLQLELGSYPTSYIPTYGTAVTRPKQSYLESLKGEGVIGTEGTMYFEFEGLEDGENSKLFTLSDKTSNNRLTVQNIDGLMSCSLVSGGSTQATVSTSVPVDRLNKVAIGYAADDVRVYINGISVLTDTSATIPTMDTITIGKNEASLANYAAMDVYNFGLTKEAHTNDELKQISLISYDTYQDLVDNEGLNWESPSCSNDIINALKTVTVA
jgi:hypothetical protein